jgi:hypothetical protein
MANKKYKLPKYNNGGNFFNKAGELGKNASLGYADIFMSAVGMDNVVKDEHYQGYGAKAARGTSDVVGGVAKAALPIAANILAPGSGAAVGAAQQGLGMLNPQDPIKYDEYGMPIQPEKRTTQKIGNVAGQITSAAAPAIASAAASNSSSSSSGSGSARNGGIMRYYNGGNVSNITQVDGPSHENGGVNIQTPTGQYEVEKQEVIAREPAQDRILSDKLRFPGSRKTIAQDFKPVEQLNKIINNMKLPKEVRASAEAKLKSEFDNFYNSQEALKQTKVANYAKRMGVALPSMLNEQSQTQFGNGGVKTSDRVLKEKELSAYRDELTQNWLASRANLEGKRFGPDIQTPSKKLIDDLLGKYSSLDDTKFNKAYESTMNGIKMLQDIRKPYRYEDFTNIPEQKFGNGGSTGKSITGYNPQTGAHYITPGVGRLTDKQLIAEGYVNEPNKDSGEAVWRNTTTNLYYKPYKPGQAGYDANAASATPYTLKYNPDVEARTQIRSTNNTPNPIDQVSRKPIEFGNIGAYDPNTGVMTESTGFNQPIEPQIINVGKNTINRNGGVFKYANGGEYGPETNSPNYLPQQNWALGQSPMMNDAREPVGMGIQGDPYDPTRGLSTDSGTKTDYSPYMQIGSQILQGLGQNVGNLYDLKRGKETEVEKYDRLTANLLNAEATKANNKRLYKNSLDSLKGAVSGSSSAYIQSRMGMDINRMAQDQLAQQAVDNANAGILNTTGAANQQISTNEKIANAQNRAAGRNLQGSAYSNIGQNIMGQSRDVKATQMDSKTLDAIIASNPKWANSAEGKAYIKQFKK